MAPCTAIRVLVADETLLGCQLLKTALARFRSRFAVVACANTSSEISEFLQKSPVDVAVVSSNLRGGPFAGFEALNTIKTSFPVVQVVMLLKYASRDLVVDAFRAGAVGVVCRTEPVRVLCKCIQTVHKGQIWANSQQLRYTLQALRSSAPLRMINSMERPELTQREDEIVKLVAEGMGNEEIAEKLRINELAVSKYLSRIYDKLDISSRVELALYRAKASG